MISNALVVGPDPVLKEEAFTHDVPCWRYLILLSACLETPQAVFLSRFCFSASPLLLQFPRKDHVCLHDLSRHLPTWVMTVLRLLIIRRAACLQRSSFY
jgi:hypothetical protein